MTKKWMSVDPGVVTAGWAVWEDTKLLYANSLVLPQSFRKLHTHFECVDELARSVYRPGMSKVLVEFPTVRSGSAVGIAAAEDVLMIAYMCGTLAGLFGENVEFIPVAVRDWKGSMPKDVCRRRIKRCGIDLTLHDEHSVDAIGIGLWHIHGSI